MRSSRVHAPGPKPRSEAPQAHPMSPKEGGGTRGSRLPREGEANASRSSSDRDALFLDDRLRVGGAARGDRFVDRRRNAQGREVDLDRLGRVTVTVDPHLGRADRVVLDGADLEGPTG